MRIVTGLAASGKTSMLLREIAEKAEANRGRQILLVPELNSHQMERRLAAATHNHGARTAEVLTFSRLADRVFAVVGGLAQQMLTPAGQLLTLQEAARRVQVGLTAWSGLADKPELLSETLALIDECKSCMIEPETLFRASKESALDEDAALSAKLCDLAQILTQYDSLCEETLPDPRDRLTHLRDGLAESHVLDGAEVYLDGFLSYTPQELAIIEVMLSSGVPLTAAVTCDVELPDVFVTGCRTLRTLTRMAERCSRRPELVDLGAGKCRGRQVSPPWRTRRFCLSVRHMRTPRASGCMRRPRRSTNASTRRRTFAERCATRGHITVISSSRHATSGRTAPRSPWRWGGTISRCSSRTSLICCRGRR